MPLRRTWLVPAFFLAAVSAAARTQLPGMFSPTGDGLVLGRVIDGVTGAPVTEARVMTSLSDNWVLTNDKGEFVFFDLPSGAINLSVIKPGYARGTLGQRWAGANNPRDPAMEFPDRRGQRLELGEGERRDDVVIRVWQYGAISGRVVDEAGEPVVGAQVQAWARVFAGGRGWINSELPAYGRTDDRGIYRISEVLPGDHVVVVPASLITTPTTPAPVSAAVPGVATLQAIRVLGAGMPRGIVAGTSTAIAAGDWLQQTVAQAVPPPLEPGNALAYPTVFHPNGFSISDAASVRVSAAETREGVDFQLRPVSMRRVSGTVLGPSGPVGSVALMLKGAGSAAAQSDFAAAIAVSDSSGRFMFLMVPPGDYTLEALETPVEGRVGLAGGLQLYDVDDGIYVGGFNAASPWTEMVTLWASEPLSVGDEDVRDVRVTLRPSGFASGSVVFSGNTTTPAPTVARSFVIELDRADGRLVALRDNKEVEINAQGEFKSIGLPPGRYFVRAAPQQGWSLQSAMIGGRDVSVLPLDLGLEPILGIRVTFTDHPHELSGVVRDTAGKIDADAAVAIFPTDRRMWTDYGAHPRGVVNVRVDRSGRYVVNNLPAGDYFVVAVEASVMSDWQSPALFDALSVIAQRVHVGDAERRMVDLTTRRVR